MTTVNIHEAKTHLSRLLERVEHGEEITIARAGRPVARLVTINARSATRRIGFLKGKITLPDDDAGLDDEISDLFEADNLFPPEPSGRQ